MKIPTSDCDTAARLFGGCDGYTCMLTRQCISAEKECDKNIDCFDGTDELHCGGENIQTYRQADKLTDKQTDKQTDK